MPNQGVQHFQPFSVASCKKSNALYNQEKDSVCPRLNSVPQPKRARRVQISTISPSQNVRARMTDRKEGINILQDSPQIRIYLRQRETVHISPLARSGQMRITFCSTSYLLRVSADKKSSASLTVLIHSTAGLCNLRRGERGCDVRNVHFMDFPQSSLHSHSLRVDLRSLTVSCLL